MAKNIELTIFLIMFAVADFIKDPYLMAFGLGWVIVLTMERFGDKVRDEIKKLK